MADVIEPMICSEADIMAGRRIALPSGYAAKDDVIVKKKPRRSPLAIAKEKKARRAESKWKAKSKPRNP
jgi:hypothetical protein